MSKTIVVFTTRYIGENKLFSPGNCEELKVVKHFQDLAAFWGKLVQQKLQKETDWKVLKSYQKYAPENSDCKKLEYWRGILTNIQKQTNLAELAEICPQWPEKYRKVYKLKTADTSSKIYALQYLPEENEWGSMPFDIEISKIRKAWRDALETAFREQDATLYLILHGSSDMGYRGPFTVQELPSETNNHTGLATFFHETEIDSIARLLAQPSKKTAQEIVTFIEHLFIKQIQIKAIEIQDLVMQDRQSDEIKKKYEDLYNKYRSHYELIPVEQFVNLTALEKNNYLKDIIN